MNLPADAPRIFVTARLPSPAPELLRQFTPHLEVFAEERLPDRGELRAGIARCDGLLCQLTDRIDREALSWSPRLRAISAYAVGTNNIDLAEATRRGIPVANTPGVLTEATADLALALLLAAARRLGEGERLLRRGAWTGWRPTLLLGVDLRGRQLGILGPGRIGRAVAERARAFGLRIAYWGRRRHPDWEEALAAVPLSLPELLASSDIVSVHLPLTGATRHLLGAAALGAMKPGSILINTARGPIVDEAALVAALRSGPLRAAGLDVFEAEPAVHPGLLELENVVLAPHLGSATEETRSRMAELAARNLILMLEGRPPLHAVNPEVAPPPAR